MRTSGRLAAVIAIGLVAVFLTPRAASAAPTPSPVAQGSTPSRRVDAAAATRPSGGQRALPASVHRTAPRYRVAITALATVVATAGLVLLGRSLSLRRRSCLPRSAWQVAWRRGPPLPAGIS